MPLFNNIRGQVFSVKKPLEAVDLGFGFYPLLRGQAIAAAAVVISVEAGADDNPQAMVVGEPTITKATILQRISGGTPGATYRLSFQATTASGQVFEEVGYLPVMGA